MNFPAVSSGVSKRYKILFYINEGTPFVSLQTPFPHAYPTTSGWDIKN